MQVFKYSHFFLSFIYLLNLITHVKVMHDCSAIPEWIKASSTIHVKSTAQPRLHLIYILASLLIIFFANSAYCSEDASEIRVACEQDFKPYCFKDKKGQPAGFGVDLTKAVAEAMDIPVRIYPATWDGAWNGLVEGRFDALPIVAKLPSRTPLVDFSLPHTETFDSFFVRSGAPFIKNIKGAEGKEIIVMRSDAAHHALMERGFKGKVIPVDGISEMLSLFASGKHDALLYPKLLGIIKMKELKLRGIKAGPTIPDYKREFSFAVQKGDTELLEKLNQGLLIVKSNGEYRRIYEKWFGFEDPWLKFGKYFWPAVIMAISFAILASFIIVILQKMVKRRTIELAEKNRMLSQARLELSERVDQRTAELLKANAALETENAERRLIEAILRESEERYRSFIEVTGQIGWVTDAEGMVVNDLPAWRKYTGQSFEEIKGAGWASALHPDDVERTVNIWHRAVTELSLYETEYRIRKTDGTYRHFLARGIPLFRNDRTVREWVGTAIDITERKHAEDVLRKAHEELENRIAERTAELKQANVQLQHEIYERGRMEDELIKAQKLESLGVFAGGIAHDFNNLLQTISNSISVAKLHASGNPSVDMLKDAETASRYASHLSHRLLTFAKGGSPVKKVTSISSVIEESISLSLSGSSIVCESMIPEDLHPAEIDEGQINQVFTNLLINAKEAMPGGGKIKVSAANMSVGENEQQFLEKGEYIRISVEDHGTGIQEENLNKIFDPYFSTKERGAEKGTGLGLSVCHSIVMKHGGLITVESKVGFGTTFHVFLPASTKPLVKDEKRRIELGTRGGRILFMEDERNMWASTRLLFKVMGYEVQFAMNGEEALSLYSEALEAGKPFDGVILDLTIPGGMGGKETMRLLREIDRDVRAIVVSGYAEDPVMTNFRQFGFVCALAKPYTIEQLKEAVCEEFV